MTFYPLTENDAYNQDPDNDGLLTIDELFVYHTDPRHPDSDYDGLTDYEELFVYNSDPLDPNSISVAYCDDEHNIRAHLLHRDDKCAIRLSR